MVMSTIPIVPRIRPRSIRSLVSWKTHQKPPIATSPATPPPTTSQAPAKNIQSASSTSLIQSSAAWPVSGISTCTPLATISAIPPTKQTVVSTAATAPTVDRLFTARMIRSASDG
jgi:cytoskeletal protein RodZ